MTHKLLNGNVFVEVINKLLTIPVDNFVHQYLL